MYGFFDLLGNTKSFGFYRLGEAVDCGVAHYMWMKLGDDVLNTAKVRLT